MSMQIITTVTVEVAGEQTSNIVSSQRTESAHVQIQLDGLWITALDAAAVTPHAYAWANARAEAADLLPHVADIKGTPRRLIASLVLRQSGWVQPQVFRIPAAGPDEQPYIEVRVGTLRVRAYDRAAVESIAQAWERALATASTIWTIQPRKLEIEPIGALMGRKGHPAIVQTGLPPAT